MKRWKSTAIFKMKEEKDHLFFKHFKMTLYNEEVRMITTDQFQR